MPAITTVKRSQESGLLSTRRNNWASREPGVVLVFSIVFVLALGIVALFSYRKWMAWKAKRMTFETVA